MPGKFNGGQDIGHGKRRLSKVDLDEEVALSLARVVEATGAPATHHVNEAVRGYTAAQLGLITDRSRPRVGARG